MESKHAERTWYFVAMVLFCPLGNLGVFFLLKEVISGHIREFDLLLLLPILFFLVPVGGYLIGRMGGIFAKGSKLRGPAIIMMLIYLWCFFPVAYIYLSSLGFVLG